MDRMNQEQLIELICQRLQGELSPAQAEQLDALVASDPRAARIFRQVERMDRALSTLPALAPSAGFTSAVLRRTHPAIETVKERSVIYDWIVGLAPALGIAIVTLIWGRDLWNRAVSDLSIGAGWLDQLLGTNLFSEQPFILLALLIPVAVIAVAYPSLQDNWRAEI